MTPYSPLSNQNNDLTTIYDDPNEKLTIVKGSMDHKDFFASVLRLRADAYKMPQAADEMDSYSDLYILSREHEPIATMRITKAKHGRIECEEYYPQELLSEYRDMAATATRFARARTEASNPLLMALLIQEIARDHVNQNILINFSNTPTKLIPYYKAVGYDILCGSFFKHPRLGTPSYVMLMLADPRVPSLIQDAFRESRDLAFLDMIRSKVSICERDDCFTEQTLHQRFVCPHKTLPTTPEKSLS